MARPRPRIRPVALLVAAIFAPLAGIAWADPTVGTAQGNALNPAGIVPTTIGRWMDEEGMGTRIPAARNPTGQLYTIPVDNPDETDVKKTPGWKSSGFLELGGLGVYGDANAAGFLQYKDLKSGPYVNLFGANAENAQEARFMEAAGGALGMDDQFYSLQFGRYNDWKVTAFFSGTPQVLTTTYRSLWSGLGTSNLTLNPGMAPGGTTSAAVTQANILNALANTPDSTLETIRKKAGVRLDMRITDAWRLFASFTDETKQGAQPFGAVFGGGGGGGNVETAQSIDYTTYDFSAGAQYGDPLTSFNVRAAASFFRNGVDTMSFQNPLFVTLNGTAGLSPTSFTQGRFDLAPNNEHFNLKGEYARKFPDFYRSSLTATVAVGTMRQNDNLVAPSEFDLAGGTVTPGGVSLSNMWNTTSALSRPSAEARIDTLLADLAYALKPMSDLDVRAKVRYYETHNEMPMYLACNPLTGQWGRVLNDGSGMSLLLANTVTGANPAGTSPNAFNAAHCDLAATRALGLAPTAGNVPIGSVPYDYTQLTSTLSADYRVGRASTLGATLERENFHRDFRERGQTWEDRIKLDYTDRGLLEGTIRVSYEHDDRGGSDYNPNPYQSFYSAGMGPVPLANTVSLGSWFHAIDQFRSFDLADRRQDVLKGRLNYAFTENLDGAFTLQVKDASYPSDLGRVGRQKNNSATFDLNYQAGSNAVVYGYYSYQNASVEQKGVQPNSCTMGSTYYFYSDGRIANAPTGSAPPPTPSGVTLVTTQAVAPGNWSDVCGNASATSPLFPDSRGWDVASKDANNTVGLGVRYDFGKVKLDTDFTRMMGRTRINYTYNAAALGMTALQAGLAGDGLSDLVFQQNVLNASLLVPINATFAMRLAVRYESGKIRDWHYDGVAANPMPTNNSLYLDAGPQDYRTTAVGIFFQLRM